MSFNYSTRRSFAAHDSFDSNPTRDSVSNRQNYTSNALSNITARELPTNEAYYPFDDRLTDAIRKFRGPIANESPQPSYHQVTPNSHMSKRSLDSDADDLFDNFDKCYNAKFPREGAIPTTSGLPEPKAKPVCRDLLRELGSDATKASSGPSGRHLPANSGNSSLQKPREFHTLRADKYFNIRASSNLNTGNRAYKEEDKIKNTLRESHPKSVMGQTNRSASISNVKNESSRHHHHHHLHHHQHYGHHEAKVTHRDEEIADEDEEVRHKGVKNFMFVQNAAFSKIDKNYEAVQKTLSKIRRRDGRDASGDWAVLNDITNNHEKQIRRGSVKETGEYRMSGELATRRRHGEEKGVEYGKKVVNNGGEVRRRINVSEMIASYHSKENSHPTVRSSYNGKPVERSKSRENGKSQGRGNVEKGIGYMREANESRGVVERKNSRNDKESISTYQALMKYYELAKKSSKGEGNGTRSTSVHRW